MDKDEVFAEKYSSKIQEYVNKGYAKKLSEVESQRITSKTWYLPHFGVINPNKPEKLRFVFDAAAKSSNISINDELLQGPDLLTPLIAVLWRFRQWTIAFSGDIKEMFHQVRIREEDRQAHRFLFRGMDRQREPDEYEMQVMTFGATCSPCLAQYVKNKNAEEFKEEFPEAYISITKRHYVDDYLDSANTEEEAFGKVKDVIEVHHVTLTPFLSLI